MEQQLSCDRFYDKALTNKPMKTLMRLHTKFEDTKRSNQKPYIEEETIQWPKEKRRSTKHCTEN